MPNITASSTRNGSLTTLLKWDEDTELLVVDNPSTEDFTAQADNPMEIEFRRFNNEVHFLSTVLAYNSASFNSIFFKIVLIIIRKY